MPAAQRSWRSGVGTAPHNGADSRHPRRDDGGGAGVKMSSTYGRSARRHAAPVPYALQPAHPPHPACCWRTRARQRTGEHAAEAEGGLLKARGASGQPPPRRVRTLPTGAALRRRRLPHARARAWHAAAPPCVRGQRPTSCGARACRTTCGARAATRHRRSSTCTEPATAHRGGAAALPAALLATYVGSRARACQVRAAEARGGAQGGSSTSRPRLRDARTLGGARRALRLSAAAGSRGAEQLRHPCAAAWVLAACQVHGRADGRARRPWRAPRCAASTRARRARARRAAAWAPWRAARAMPHRHAAFLGQKHQDAVHDGHGEEARAVV